MRVGFIGLGNMGSAMAANLIKAGHALTVYNRSAAKAQPLVDQGAAAATRIDGACRGEVVITMLADDAALDAVVFGDGGVLASLTAGAIHIGMSTIGVDLSQRVAAAHARAGQHYVAAPVFGRPQAAAAAALFIVAAGEAEVLRTCQTLFDAIGQRTFIVDHRPASANLIKLSGNFLLATVIEALGEAMALIEKAGVDRRQYIDLLTATLFSAPAYKTYGGLIAERKFSPAGFAVALGLKDIRLTLSAAEHLQVPLPLASLLRDRFLTALAQGDAALDWSAIADLSARDAGLPTKQS
jgi:3-hydroxyisobutyrate dehydrogenase-like beta-hydroxyacid dehydrogenase